jgi:hypothetical protein
MKTSEEVSRMHLGQQTVQEELAAHRNDHAKSHSRILEIQEGQHRMDHVVEEIQTEQKETSSKLTEAGKLDSIQGTSAH